MTEHRQNSVRHHTADGRLDCELSLIWRKVEDVLPSSSGINSNHKPANNQVVPTQLFILTSHFFAPSKSQFASTTHLNMASNTYRWFNWFDTSNTHQSARITFIGAMRIGFFYLFICFSSSNRWKFLSISSFFICILFLHIFLHLNY